MKARMCSGAWLVAFSVSCSSSDGADFFEGPSSSSSTTTASAGTMSSTTAAATNSTGSDGSTTTGVSSTAQGAATSGAGGATASSSTSAGEVTSVTSAGGASTSIASSSSSTSDVTTTSAGGSGGSNEPVEVVLEYDADEDCVELQCPTNAPHLVACDITFSLADDEYACLALEPESLVFIKSGDSCEGSVINAGSTITCSNVPLDGEITDEECLTNKEELDVVTDRCDCEAAFEIDEC